MIIKFVKYIEKTHLTTLGYLYWRKDKIRIKSKNGSFIDIVKNIKKEKFNTSKGVVSWKNGKIFLSVLPEIFKSVYLYAYQVDKPKKINESEASDQAHKLGLTSAGFGRWINPKIGKIVAKTVDGKLQRIDYNKNESRPKSNISFKTTKYFNEKKSAIERKLSSIKSPDKKPSNNKFLYQGINQTQVIELSDGSLVINKKIHKSIKDEDIRNDILYGEQNEREIFAYQLWKLIPGFSENIICPAVTKDQDDSDAINMEFLSGFTTAFESGMKNSDELKKPIMFMSLFDGITLNSDRHGGNWMINEETKELAIIDNGLIFSKYGGEDLKFDIESIVKNRDQLIEVCKDILDKIEEIDTLYEENGIKNFGENKKDFFIDIIKKNCKKFIKRLQNIEKLIDYSDHYGYIIKSSTKVPVFEIYTSEFDDVLLKENKGMKIYKQKSLRTVIQEGIKNYINEDGRMKPGYFRLYKLNNKQAKLFLEKIPELKKSEKKYSDGSIHYHVDTKIKEKDGINGGFALDYDEYTKYWLLTIDQEHVDKYSSFLKQIGVPSNYTLAKESKNINEEYVSKNDNKYILKVGSDIYKEDTKEKLKDQIEYLIKDYIDKIQRYTLSIKRHYRTAADKKLAEYSARISELKRNKEKLQICKKALKEINILKEGYNYSTVSKILDRKYHTPTKKQIRYEQAGHFSYNGQNVQGKYLIYEDSDKNHIITFKPSDQKYKKKVLGIEKECKTAKARANYYYNKHQKLIKSPKSINGK